MVVEMGISVVAERERERTRVLESDCLEWRKRELGF